MTTVLVHYKGSSKSGNYGHAGRRGKVGGSAPKGSASALSPESIAIMEKYKNEQAWNEPIREFMEANGLTLDDYKKAKEALYAHNVASGAESDKRLSNLWNSDTPEGKALQLMSQWQEWQVKNVRYKPEYKADRSVYDELNGMTQEKYDSSKMFRSGSNLAPTPERLVTLYRAQDAGKTLFFRKGGLDHAALSTTSNMEGAISGTSQFKPDRFFTFDELKAEGYHLLSGARGSVGVTSDAEHEYIWLKPLPSSNTKELSVQFRYKGSAKSGNYKHHGRPGQVGGSSPSATHGYQLARYTNLEDMPAYQRHGNDISPELVGDYWANYREDKYLKELMHDQGFDNLPDVVSTEQMDAYVASGEQEIWRGIHTTEATSDASEAAGFAEQFKSGELFVGLGMFGNGTYAGRTGSALDFIMGDDHGVITRMTIRKDAKVAEINQVVGEMQDDFNAHGLTAANVDNGHWGTIKGYDVIHVPLDMISGTDEQWLVLNRSAVRVDNHVYTYDEVGALWQAGNKAVTIQFRYKGSAKSGNYGHAGIPGHLGGSALKGFKTFDYASEAGRKEMDAWMKANKPVLNEQEQAAVDSYTHGPHINVYLRYGSYGNSPHASPNLTPNMIKEIDASSAKEVTELSAVMGKATLPEDMTVFRGAKLHTDMEPGQVITDKGFISTSLNKAQAVAFTDANKTSNGKPTLMEVRVPAGTNAIINPGKGTFKENEVILPPGTQFKVLSVERGQSMDTTREMMASKFWGKRVGHFEYDHVVLELVQ